MSRNSNDPRRRTCTPEAPLCLQKGSTISRLEQITPALIARVGEAGIACHGSMASWLKARGECGLPGAVAEAASNKIGERQVAALPRFTIGLVFSTDWLPSTFDESHAAMEHIIIHGADPAEVLAELAAPPSQES